jgi:hypothetical protein
LALSNYYPSNITFDATSSIGSNFLTFSTTNLPIGITLQSTGSVAILVGTPLTVTPAQSFTISATDGIATQTLTYPISVCNDLFYFSSNSMRFIQNVEISNVSVSATTLSGRQVQSFSAPTPPPGLVFSPNGVLSGTPLQDSSSAFVVNATTGFAVGTNLYSYEVLPDQILFAQPQRIYDTVFDVPITPIQVVAAAYSGTVVNPYALTGNIGTGLTISSTGLLTGTIPGSVYSNNPIVTVDASAARVRGSTTFTVVTDVPRLDVSIGALSYATLQKGLQVSSNGATWGALDTLNAPFSTIGATGNFYEIVSNSNILLAAGTTLARSGLTFNWSNVLMTGEYTSLAVEPGTSNIHALQSSGGVLSELLSSNNGATWSSGPALGLPSYSSANVYRRRGGIVRYGGGTLLVGGGTSNVARRGVVDSVWTSNVVAPGIQSVYDLAYDSSANRWVVATSVVDVSPGTTNGFVALGDASVVYSSLDGLNWTRVPTSTTDVRATNLATDGFGNWATNGRNGVMLSSGTPTTLWFDQTTNYQGLAFPSTFDVRFGNSTFFLFGSNAGSAQVWYSDTYGSPTWYWQSALLDDPGYSVLYGGDANGQNWFAYGYSNSTLSFMKAPFGQGSNLEWTPIALPIALGDFSVTDSNPGRIRYNATLDKWLLVGTGSSNPIFVGTPSVSDISWSSVVVATSRPGFAYALSDIAYSPQESTWVAVGTKTSNATTQSAMITSVDGGVSWTDVDVTRFYANNINRILWTGGTWMVSGTETTNRIQLAFNDVSTMYRLVDSGQPNNVTILSIAMDTYTNPPSNVASVFYSSDDDGVTWTPQTGVSGYSATRVAHSNGLWIGGGYDIDAPTGVYQPTVYKSSDGHTWSNANALTNYLPSVGNADLLTTVQPTPGGWSGALRSSNVLIPGGATSQAFYSIGSNVVGSWTRTPVSLTTMDAYFNQILSSNRYFPTGLPFPSIQFQSNTGGPVFHQSESSYTFYEYVPIAPIHFQVTSTDGYVYFFSSALPIGLTFNSSSAPNRATLSGTPCRLGNNQAVTVYATDSTGTSSFTLRLSVVLPRVVKVQDGAGSYTALVRQYTNVNADQNARDNVVFPGGLATPGTFQASYPPDTVTATIPANCAKSC